MINNEFVRDESRKQKLSSVNHFAMFRWREDQVVFPTQSAWFGTYDGDGHITKLRDTDMYKEDWLGLRKLDEEGKLHFYSGSGGHMSLDEFSAKRMLVPMMLGKKGTDLYHDSYDWNV